MSRHTHIFKSCISLSVIEFDDIQRGIKLINFFSLFLNMIYLLNRRIGKDDSPWIWSNDKKKTPLMISFFYSVLASIIKTDLYCCNTFKNVCEANQIGVLKDFLESIVQSESSIPAHLWRSIIRCTYYMHVSSLSSILQYNLVETFIRYGRWNAFNNFPMVSNIKNLDANHNTHTHI